MAYETILYEKKAPIATITLNRPEALNAISQQMTGELHRALDEADADREVRAIILGPMAILHPPPASNHLGNPAVHWG
jgi:enoyl-CoA hydratase/carnithine racemase